MSPEGAPRGVEMSSLPEEKRAKIDRLDARADEIQDLRSSLARRLKDIRQWIPTLGIKTAKGFEIGPTATLLEIVREAGVDGDPMSRFDLAGLDEDDRLDAEVRIGLAIDAARKLEKAGGIRPGADAEPNDAEAYDFYKARYREYGEAAAKLTELRIAAQDKLEQLRRFIAKAYDAKPGKFDAPKHAAIVRRIVGEHKQLVEKLREHILSSPEAYIAAKLINLSELKRHFDGNGRIVETAYVKQMKDVARDKIRSRPALFVTGELGAGKTEFAKDLARDLWLEKNPAPVLPPELKAAATTEEKNRIRKEWAAKREAWLARRDGPDGWEPLMVYGSKNIQEEAIAGGRGIERGEAVPAGEQTKRIAEAWERFVAELPADSPARSDLDSARADFRQSMLESYRSPVKTVTFLGPIFRAMKEGRPLVIDEMNAIPHHVLIAMNDLLLRRPGERVYPPFPGEPSFEVAPGFVVIATGNYKPEDGKAYVGRQQIDAAFLSRFGQLAYDYLPMPTESLPAGSSPEAEREFRAKCEQVTMFVLRLLNEDMTLDIPESAFGPDGQIERLSVVARRLQDAFSAPEDEKGFYERVCGGEVNVKEILKENVLSIRHVVPVLESWQKGGGFQTSLDVHLFQNYVSNSKNRPDEMVLLYGMLQTHGRFFPTVGKDGKPTGWPDAMLPDSREKILNLDIRNRLYGRDSVSGERSLDAGKDAAEPVHFTQRQVVEWLSGKVPERTAVPRGFSERDEKGADGMTAAERRMKKMMEEEEAHRFAEWTESDEFAEFARDMDGMSNR